MSPGWVLAVAGLAALEAGLIIAFTRDRRDRALLLILWGVGGGARLLAALVLPVYARAMTGSPFLFGDEPDYHLRAARLAEDWAGGRFLQGVAAVGSLHVGQEVFIAAVYRLFGSDPQGFRILQAVLNAPLGMLVFLLAREFTAGALRPAAVAGLAAAVFPTGVLVSATLLRDANLALATAGFALGAVRWLRRGGPLPPVIILVSFLVIATMRFYAAAVLLLCLAPPAYRRLRSAVGAGRAGRQAGLPAEPGSASRGNRSAKVAATVAWLAVAAVLAVALARLAGVFLVRYGRALWAEAVTAEVTGGAATPGAAFLSAVAYFGKGLFLTLLHVVPWESPSHEIDPEWLAPLPYAGALVLPLVVIGLRRLPRRPELLWLAFLPAMGMQLFYIGEYGAGSARQWVQTLPLLVVFLAWAWPQSRGERLFAFGSWLALGLAALARVSWAAALATGLAALTVAGFERRRIGRLG